MKNQNPEIRLTNSRRNRRGFWASSPNVLLSGALILGTGCTTYSQEGPLTEPQVASLLANDKQNLVVGVDHLSPEARGSFDPDSYYEFADKFLEAVRKSGLFAEVDYAERLGSRPDIYVRLDWGREHYLCEPLLTVLTIGIIPTPCKEKSTYVVRFRHDRTDSSKGEVTVKVEKELTRWYGLLIGPLNLFPGFGRRFENPSLADHLVLEVSKNIYQVRSLADQVQIEDRRN